jgi:pilus assembly protein CpaD
MTMRSKLVLIALGSALAGCSTVGRDLPDRGVAASNVPVVTTTNYVIDVAAPGGTLAPREAERLDAWFQTLGLGYGDTIYIDGNYAPAAQREVANVAGQYGMLVAHGSPVTVGAVGPDSIRVVVARHTADVPGCPNWRTPSQPNFENRSMSNYGCGVNANLAMQVAKPQDLLYGREGPSAIDAATGAKAILLYRSWPLTAVIDGQVKRPFKAIESSTTTGNR